MNFAMTSPPEIAASLPAKVCNLPCWPLPDAYQSTLKIVVRHEYSYRTPRRLTRIIVLASQLGCTYNLGTLLIPLSPFQTYSSCWACAYCIVTTTNCGFVEPAKWAL